MIYLDNAATTKPSEEAKAAALAAMDSFGNPSSLHRLGLNAEKVIKASAKSVSNVLGCTPENVIFTSGGTESNNTAIFSAANMSKKRHIITSVIEHPSVLEPFKLLEKEGWRVDRVGVDNEGMIKLDELEKLLDDDTALVSVMHVNNETGTIQPIERVKELIDKYAEGALFHVDAVQSFGKIPVKIKQIKPDFLSVSAHKIHGIKGTGALYVKNAVRPLIVGGGQQKGNRSGTENVVGIAAFGAAAKECSEANDYILALRNRLKEGIEEKIPNVRYNGSKCFSPYLLNISFIGIKSEILLHSLESSEIYVSTGSACSSNKPMPSHVLTAMGCSKEEINGAVRFSLSDEIGEEDIDFVIDRLCEKVAEIRKYMR